MYGTTGTILYAGVIVLGILACIPLIFWLDRFGRG